MSQGSHWGAQGIAVCVLALAVLAPGALAKTYRPTRRNDPVPNGCHKHDCSLREAVIKANHHAGKDTIALHARKTYNLHRGGVGENAANKGDLDIKGTLKIKSGGSPAKVDANGIDRVFDVGPVTTAHATFKLLVIRGGHINGTGGGVNVNAGSSVRISRSTLSGNSSGRGGGLMINGIGASVVRSTISRNEVGASGGGIDVDVGSLSVTNSTIAGNRAGADGGGIDHDSLDPVTLSSVTVARNHAVAAGGGLWNGTMNPFTLRNSIVALNTGGATPDCSGTFSSAGVNLFTSLTGCTGFSTPPNIVTPNPRLGPLKHNGGPTKTIALLKHSPAINQAGTGSPSRDQRGHKRHNPDIGAFER